MIVKKVMRESKFCKLAFVWTRVGFVAPPFCFARVDSGSSKSRVDAEATPCLTRTTMGRLRPQEKRSGVGVKQNGMCYYVSVSGQKCTTTESSNHSTMVTWQGLFCTRYSTTSPRKTRFSAENIQNTVSVSEAQNFRVSGCTNTVSTP